MFFDENQILYDQAIELAAEAMAQQCAHQSARTHDAIEAWFAQMWPTKGAQFVAAMSKKIDLGPVNPWLLNKVGKEVLGQMLPLVVDRSASGGRQPVALAWQPLAPPATSAIKLPTMPVTSGDYVIAYDPHHDAFVYAPCHAHHQFGRAWMWNGVTWTVLSAQSYRLSSAQQAWTGTYDAGRGGIVGWNFDNAPVGVVIHAAGISVIADAALFEQTKTYGGGNSNAVRVVATGDFPKASTSWGDELNVAFGFDRSRNVWVALSDQGVWELDVANVWRKMASIAPNVLPTKVDGRRAFGGYGGVGAVWDAPRNRVVFWFWADKTLVLIGWSEGQLVRLPNHGISADLVPRFGRSVGGVVGEDPRHGLVVLGGPKVGVMAIGVDGRFGTWPPNGEPPLSQATAVAISPTGAALLGPGNYATGDDDTEDQKIFWLRARNGQWTCQGALTKANPLEHLVSSG
jgi:hypothetical protein